MHRRRGQHLTCCAFSRQRITFALTIGFLTLVIGVAGMASGLPPAPIAGEAVPTSGAAVQAGRSVGPLKIEGSLPLSGVYADQVASGHFEVEVEDVTLHHGGLVLVGCRDGSPDPNDVIGVVCDRDAEQRHVVRLICRKTGRSFEPNEPNSRNRHVLDGGYSKPFVEPDGRLKIARNRLSGSFHLYYGVTKDFGGLKRRGWLELTPIADWLPPETTWRPAVVSLGSGSAPVTVDSGRLVIRFPKDRDRDDRPTGFSGVRRPFTWSGFQGEAVVVSFDEHFSYRDRDYKFVFWERANYVPVWRFDEQTLFCYEFVETWDEEGRGCYEPMSDRLCVSSRAAVVEDNAVRKVIEWRYELLNPDYQVPSEGEGRQRPEVVERYACYPDGRIVRHIVYTPKLDGRHRSWNELGEFIAIAGNQHHASDLLGSPALTVTRDHSEPLRFFPGPPQDLHGSAEWEVITAAAHFARHPDAIAAFSNLETLSTTTPGNRVRAEVSWHGPGYRMSHWPVGLEPYLMDNLSPHGQRRQVTHSSLLGFAAVGDDEWRINYETDNRGRRFRQWSSLVALADPHNPDERRAIVNSWLYPGELDPKQSPEVTLIANDTHLGEVVLLVGDSDRAAGAPISFVWRRHPRADQIYHPCFRLKNVPGKVTSVQREGTPLVRGIDYSLHQDDAGVLVWLILDTAEPVALSLTVEQR